MFVPGIGIIVTSMVIQNESEGAEKREEMEILKLCVSLVPRKPRCGLIPKTKQNLTNFIGGKNAFNVCLNLHALVLLLM